MTKIDYLAAYAIKTFSVCSQLTFRSSFSDCICVHIGEDKEEHLSHVKVNQVSVTCVMLYPSKLPFRRVVTIHRPTVTVNDSGVTKGRRGHNPQFHFKGKMHTGNETFSRLLRSLDWALAPNRDPTTAYTFN